MNKSSSAFLLSDNVITSMLSADNFLTRLIKVLLQVLYFACKWLMYIVDVIYFYVMQLVGVSVDTTIFDSLNSDMTMKLLLDNKDIVIKIIKNFIAIALIIILVTSIIAIIKQQYESMKEGASKNNPAKDTMGKALKSIMLLVLTPMIAFVGIIGSNVLLQSLFKATSLSDSKSLSTTVFNAASSSANKYRAYANNGVRIPIVYNFSGDTKSKAINYTVQMVGNESYPKLAYFDINKEYSGIFSDPVLKDTSYDSRNDWLDIYYTYYDSSSKYDADDNTGVNKYRRLVTHVDEYYAMADVVTYALDSMSPLYFVTIEDVLASMNEMGEAYYNTNLKKLVKDVWKIGTTTDYIKYTTKYSGKDYEYYHINGSRDETDGAKFIIAYKKEVVEGAEASQNIYGDYVQITDPSGTSSGYYEAEKFYLKSGISYKKVDLYYVYNTKTGEYLKVAQKNFSMVALSEGGYYYKIGEDYIQIDVEKQNFYYKDEINGYQQIDLKGAVADNTSGGVVDDEDIDLSKLQIFYNITKKWHYMPLTNGDSADGGVTVFNSDYITSGMITARGIFDDQGNPTAIRKTEKGKLLFYRDNLELVANGEASDFATIDQIEAEEDSEDEEGEESSEKKQGFFAKIGSSIKKAWNSVRNFFSGLFNPAKLVPDLRLDESKISTTYTKKTSLVKSMEEPKLHISYFFSDALTSKLIEENYGFDINCLFDPTAINWVVLVVGSVCFFKVMTTAVFGLINRTINIFFLVLIYPIACSTLPYEEADNKAKAQTYDKWKKKFMGLLFSTYGLILSLNFVFIIISVVDKLEFFKTEDFVTNRILGRLGNALYNPWMILGIDAVFTPNYSLICRFVNAILKIIFELAAFALIAPVGGKGKGDTFYSVIQTVVGTGPGPLEDSPIDNVKKLLKTFAKTVNFVLFPGKAIKDYATNAAKKAKSVAKNMIPGSAVVEAATDKAKVISARMNKMNTKELAAEGIRQMQNQGSQDASDEDT